jgi:hypothetical protein
MVMTVERAILLTVGGLIIVSVLLVVYVNINWLWLTGILGGIVLIRTFLSFSLDVEIEGRWPGRGAKPRVNAPQAAWPRASDPKVDLHFWYPSDAHS